MIVADLEFDLATPGSAVRHTTKCAMEPDNVTVVNMSLGYKKKTGLNTQSDDCVHITLKLMDMLACMHMPDQWHQQSFAVHFLRSAYKKNTYSNESFPNAMEINVGLFQNNNGCLDYSM